MQDQPDSFDDLEDLGDDPIDRSGDKRLSAGPPGGGGSDIDPSYEEALRILGREHEMPPPWAQRAIIMENAEAADLARLLTALRGAAGVLFGSSPGGPAWDTAPEDLSADQAVEAYIAALQMEPVDVDVLQALSRRIAEAGLAEVQQALQELNQHPAIYAKLHGQNPAREPGFDIDLDCSK